MIRGTAAMVLRALRRAALPMAAYYAITIAVPLANGASQSGAVFVRHALIVLVVPPVAVILGCAVYSLAQVALRSAP